jgi:hypothetical protein
MKFIPYFGIIVLILAILSPGKRVKIGATKLDDFGEPQ